MRTAPRRSCIRTLLPATIVGVLLVSAEVVGDPANPFTMGAGVTYHVEIGGMPASCTTTRWFTDSGWKTAFDPWDDYYTSEGRRYSHAFFEDGFPFYDGANYVTKAKVNQYWDNYVFYGFSRVGEPTCAQNCHGYTVDLQPWVFPGTGSDYVMEDDYEQLVEEPTAGCVGYMSWHSVWVSDVYVFNPGQDKVKKTTQKMGSSGYYYKYYDYPGVYLGCSFYEKK